jgi:outer membrane protein assembly factor BamD
VLVLLTVAACGKRPGAVEQLPPEGLYAQAQSAFDRHKWNDAVELFERFTIQYPTNPRASEARYRLGEAYFNKHEYVTAANEFSRLANDYPAGPWADDARFMVCRSYERLSPRAELDQNYTRAAIDHCQSLLTYYPTSDFAERAKEIIADLRSRLAQKEYLSGEFYMKRNAYDSAIIYFENAIRLYPDTSVAPRALLKLFETYEILGYKEEASSAKERLLKDYPSSPEAKQVGEPAAKTQT